MQESSDEHVTSMSSKGQVVIVKELRDELNLEPNQKFYEKVEGDRIVLIPIPTQKQLKGSLKKIASGKSTDALIKEIKEGWD